MPDDLPIRRCLTCDYPLDHLPTQRGPECGTQFDLNRPETYANTADQPVLDASTCFALAIVTWIAVPFGWIVLAEPGLRAGLILSNLTAFCVLCVYLFFRGVVRGRRRLIFRIACVLSLTYMGIELSLWLLFVVFYFAILVL